MAENSENQVEEAFAKLAERMQTFGASLLSVGAVLRGLQGTREGYQLSYSIQHIFFEIADALRVPIRFIANEFEGLANVSHELNHAISGALDKTDVGRFAGEAMDANKGLGFAIGNLIGGELRKAAGAQPQKQAEEDQRHLQPMLKTEFGGLTELQERLQQLSTENPAQERALSLVEIIYNVLVKIYNKLPGGGELREIPAPGVKQD